MFAKLLVAPFVVLLLVFLVLASAVDSHYAPWMVPFLVIASVIYVFSPQINWWWYSRHPKDLEPGLAGLLEKFCIFYIGLETPDRKKFRERAVLFTMATDWTPVDFPDDSFPTDLQLMIAAQAVTLTFHKPDLLFRDFEKVIVYPFPFPSPEYPFAHASELHVPDGCVLFSAEQVIKSFLQPGHLYNVALHEYARVFALSYPEEPYPDFNSEAGWAGLQQASGMPRTHVENVVGLAGVDALPVAIHHYFTFPERFKETFPEETGALQQIFF